jgi:hypothetical protein
MFGRIPWGRIAEHPDHFLDNKSRPETDHSLQEPSRMTEIAVNTWLRHWLTRQQKSKRPLILKDPSSKIHTPPKDLGKGKGGKHKHIEWVEPDDEEDEDEDDNVNDTISQDGDEEANSNIAVDDGPEDSGNGPVTPSASAESRKSRRTFLKTLSEDGKYQELLLLMDAAKVMSFPRCRTMSILMLP